VFVCVCTTTFHSAYCVAFHRWTTISLRMYLVTYTLQEVFIGSVIYHCIVPYGSYSLSVVFKRLSTISEWAPF